MNRGNQKSQCTTNLLLTYTHIEVPGRVINMASQPYTKLEEEKDILEKDPNLLKVETQPSETIQNQETSAQSNETDCDIIVCSTPLAHHTTDGRETQESEKNNDNVDLTSIERRYGYFYYINYIQTTYDSHTHLSTRLNISGITLLCQYVGIFVKIGYYL